MLTHKFLASTLSLFTFLTALCFSAPAAAGEQSVYDFSWLDKDKEVFVLQNRKFRKALSPYLSLGSGMTVSGAFVDSYYFQARAGMFMQEEWGLEFLYTKAQGAENETYKSVENINNTGAGATAFRRIIDNYWGVALLWSPFYAKVNTFNSIVYVDWTIGAGFGQLTEHNNKDSIRESTPLADTTETHLGGFWETSLKFWLTQHWSVNADLVGFYYQAEKAQNIENENTKAFYSNYDLGLSLTYNF